MNIVEEIRKLREALEEMKMTQGQMLQMISDLQGSVRNVEAELGWGPEPLRLAQTDEGSAVRLPVWEPLACTLKPLGLRIHPNQEWLAELIDGTAASPAPVDRLIAVGMMVRLWASSSQDERDLRLKAALAGVSILSELARNLLAWCPVDEAYRLAASQLELLEERIATVAPEAPNQVIAARDDLESLRMALAILERSAHGPFSKMFAPDLEDLDRVWPSLVPGGYEPSDETLRLVRERVAAHEPDAWWGRA